MKRRSQAVGRLRSSCVVTGTLLAWSACVGEIGRDPRGGGSGASDPAGAGPKGSGGSSGSVTGPVGPPTGAPGAPTPGMPPKEFTLPSEQLQLLPFSVRLARVAAVAGVAVGDPLLEPMRANRISLGDHDFANGIKPDNTWSALRISDWVRAIRPVCASPQLQGRVSPLPERLDALIEAAYGRAARPEDTQNVAMAIAGVNVTDKARSEAICVAVLSSLEFLAQ